MNSTAKKSPSPKMHVVEIFDGNGKLVAGYAVREVGKLQAKNVVIENNVRVRRASEDEIADIAVNKTPVLGIPRTALDQKADDAAVGQGDLAGYGDDDLNR